MSKLFSLIIIFVIAFLPIVICTDVSAQLVEADCRSCHDAIDFEWPPSDTDAHHLLSSTKIPDPTNAPYGIPGDEFDCSSCHIAHGEVGGDILVEKDCTFCHGSDCCDGSVELCNSILYIADYDNSTNVGLSDLGIMKTEFGRFDCDITPCDADLNDDDNVGLSDLGIMKTQFGFFSPFSAT